MRVRQNSSAERKADDLVSKEWVFGPNKAYMYLELDPSIHHIFGQRYEAKIVDNQFLSKGEYQSYLKKSEWLPLNMRGRERDKVVKHVADILYDIGWMSALIGRDKLFTYFETHPEMAIEWDWLQSIPLGTKGIYINQLGHKIRYVITYIMWSYRIHAPAPEFAAIIYLTDRGLVQDRPWNTIKANDELIGFDIPQWVKDLGT